MTNILFPIGTLVAERLLYLPSMGFLLLFICFLGDAASEGNHGFPMRARQTVVWLAAISLLGFWWYLCHLRVDDWKSVEQITLVDGLKQLRSSRTQFNLANLYLQSQRMDEALVAYRRSIAADPQERDAQPLYHAGQILMYRGQYEEAEVYLHKAVTGYFSPLTLHEEEVWHDYGLVLWHVGRHMEAAHNFQNAIITNPTFPKGHNNLACALVMLGLSSQPMNTPLVQQGLQAAEQAITLAPHVPLYWRNAAVLLSLAGDQSALAAWERFRQYDPKTAAMEEANGIPRDCTWEISSYDIWYADFQDNISKFEVLGGPLGAIIGGYNEEDWLYQEIFSKAPGQALQEAFQLLGFPSDTGDWSNYMVEEISLAYRRQCLRGHPSRGGSARNYLKLQVALELVRAFEAKDLGSPEAESSETAEAAWSSPRRRRKVHGFVLDDLALVRELELSPTEAAMEADNLPAERLEELNRALDEYILRQMCFKSEIVAEIARLHENSAYSILGVSPIASDSEIKKAYRLVAMQCHPDKGGNKAEFQELHEAYEKIMEQRRSSANLIAKSGGLGP
eukprot:symbB.v1.2.038055.t1/scaffold5798.1/size23537/2